ncbi:hypothetical protein LTR56_020349 [Elasticomyces elasticus]|nr:hypothetical protein LTR56_020349 [Elasticomyces elasticus]KAK3654726.1 hypothetical protein LTR22_010628 [Elasticomyces elasticus]KAK4910317.1 hypothetical protein LTR49_020998 [Elasticomyces elasticus]KAK5750026.1 hypothetical protein LTS12_019908 [Elasticomyces elasticus]
MEEEKPSLLGLCPELRNKIYDLVMTSPYGIIVLGTTSGNKDMDNTVVSPPPPRGALAPSQTCRQLRQETLPMLFSCNTVAFDVDYYLNAGEDGATSKHNGIGTHTKDISDVKLMLEGLRNWLDSVPEDSTRHMRDVCIWVGAINMNSEDTGVAEKSLEFFYDTWTELQQHTSKLGLSGTRAARFGLYFRLKVEFRYRSPEMFDIPLRDRSEARRRAQRAITLERANLLKVQNEHWLRMGLPPLSSLNPKFEQVMVHQESAFQILALKECYVR